VVASGSVARRFPSETATELAPQEEFPEPPKQAMRARPAHGFVEAIGDQVTQHRCAAPQKNRTRTVAISLSVIG